MKLGLQTKLLTLVTTLVILASAFLIVATTAREREIFQSSFRARGIILAQSLEAGIASRGELKDLEKLQSSIYKLMWLDPEIVRIDLSVAAPEGLQVAASNNTEAIGTPADPENNLSFEQGMIITRTLLQPDIPPVLSVITPVHVGGQQVGTYDIRLSLEDEEATIRKQQRQLALLVVATVGFISLSLSLLLRRMVVIPILEIRKGSEKIRAGNLDWRITLKSRDELGDLASGFNKMAEELKKSYSSLEELAAGLEEEVKQRTKELQKKLTELERFQKLTVGRELKMVELKKALRLARQAQSKQDRGN